MINWSGGTSVEIFQKTYPTAVETASDYSSIGAREFQQNNVGNNIESRIFSFYKNRLYRIFINYGKQDNEFLSALVTKLISTYGKFDDKNESSNYSVRFI
jgi:hypothetical protein